ncbi:ABC transporter substrate-binding protein [Dactylosporangium fulvum]|uniref:ABC transporter substrate-binding protein n=1 Tax=Dactylosporangium fulvum TaxID=53359 RepID=A0ABY5W7A2_9ACTN|nr:ABC transporter substrate-binding protein [Dactylosporangium fulvum]UWP85129.1 ABC transporter substrate-binding protein [Dactylosporangium fulvum]
MRRKSLTALALLTLVAGLGACSNNKRGDDEPGPNTNRQASGSIATDPKDSKGPAAEIPGAAKGGTVTVIRQSKISHLDPQRVYSFVGLTASQLYARRLTTFKDDGKGKVVLVGDLAETPGTDVNKDCKTWEFKIKEGVKFEDGSPITAKEIAYGIARSFDLSLTGGPTYIQEWLADSPQFDTKFDFAKNKTSLPPGLSTPDDRTLKFTFAKPHCDLPFAASLPATAPMPAAKDTGTDYDKQPFSSGPYKLTKNEAGTRLTFERNTHWDPATDAMRHQYPDSFVYEFGPDPVTQTNRIIADSGADASAVSFNGVDSSLVSKVVGDQALKSRTLQEPTPSQYTLTINNNRVTDLSVRQALNYAIDRDGVVKTLGGETVARAVTTLMPPATIGWKDYDAYPAGKSGNPDKAKELLGGKTPELVLGFQDDATNQELSTHLKGNLEKAGFKITLKPIPADTFLDETKKKDNPWDLYIGSWGADWPSGASILPVLYDGRAIKAEGSNNGASYLNAPALNAEFDRILALPVAEQGPEWGKLDEKIMKEYAPVVPLYVDVMFTIHGSKVGGLFIDSIWGSVAVTNAYVKQ